MRHPFEPVARFLWIYAVGMLAFASMTSVMALYLGAEFGLDEKTIGYVFLYVGVLSFVMRSLLLGPIVDRIGESWAMRIGTLLLIVGLLLYPLPRTHRAAGPGDSAGPDRYGAALSRDDLAHVAALGSRASSARPWGSRRPSPVWPGWWRRCSPRPRFSGWATAGRFISPEATLRLVGLMALRLPPAR